MKDHLKSYFCCLSVSCLSLVLCLSLSAPIGVALADDATPKGWIGRVRGEVIKIDGDVYTVEDDLGRQLKLHVTSKAERDENVKVGDEIMARTTHRGKEFYIKSIKKIPSGGSASHLIEGKVVKIEGDSYLVKDISGREVRLHVDGTTAKDGNITIGDVIQAQIDSPAPISHANSISKR
jgi:uncharacterized protein YdeI (BOF family)